MDFGKKLEFDWDEGNSEKNWIKHKVRKKESEQVFYDPYLIVSEDPKQSKLEQRWMLIGKTTLGRTLVIIFTIKGGKLRVISARSANRKERRLYEEEKAKSNS